MSLIQFQGITIGTKSKAMIMGGTTPGEAMKNLQRYNNPLPGNQNTMSDVALWGTDNLLPQQMMADVENTGVLSAAVDLKARITVGKGPQLCKITGRTKDGQEILDFVDDPEVSDWLEMNNAFENDFATAKDLFSVGNNWRELILSYDRKNLWWRRHDPCECRLSVRDERSRRSEFVYLSGDWSQYSNVTTDNLHTGKIPLLDKDFPDQDLLSRPSGYSFMLLTQYPLFGRQYYSPSPWFSAQKWVKIAQSIPEMKEAMFRNQMQLKYVVEIHPEFWTRLHKNFKALDVKEQQKIQNDFYQQVDELLVGSENSYKSLFSQMVIDPVTNQFVSAIKVTTIDDKIKEGKLLPDGAAADSAILFALSLNPALAGVDIPGEGAVRTAGSGSNIRETYLVQVMILELERRGLAKIFNLQKKLAGWPKEYVIRYPNQILTTLNTGANTQPTA